MVVSTICTDLDVAAMLLNKFLWVLSWIVNLNVN